MSDYSDDLISRALVDFHAVEAGIPAGDLNTVHRKASHRRRARLAVTSVACLLAIATPLAVFASNPSRERTLPGVDRTQTSVMVQSSAPYSSVPDGRINKQQLLSAQIDIPAWGIDGCLSGRTRITAPIAVSEPLIEANLDNDSAPETAVILRCALAESELTQVVAIDRGLRGDIVTLGRVIGITDQITMVRNLAARKDGGLTAEVCPLCSAADQAGQYWQTREYAWDGLKFVQVAGPTTVASGLAARSDLSLTLKDVAITDAGTCGEPGEMSRRGTIKIFVRNQGSAASTPFYVHVDPSRPAVSFRIDSSTWAASIEPFQRHAALRPGETATLTVNFSMSACFQGWSIPAHLFEDGGTDTNTQNNSATVRL